MTNISRSKDNLVMKFGQLIENNMRNIVLEKSCTKCGGETIPRPFSQKSKLSIMSGSIASSFIHFVFILCQVQGYRNLLKLSCRTLAFTSDKAFLKNKNRSGISFLGSFSAWLAKENSYLVTFINQISLPGCLYFMRYWAKFVM